MDNRAHVAHSFSLGSLSDTVEYKLLDGSGQTATESGLDYCRGFHCNGDLTLVIEGAGSISGQKLTFTCAAGMYYPYSVKKFLATGSCLGTSSFIVMR